MVEFGVMIFPSSKTRLGVSFFNPMWEHGYPLVSIRDRIERFERRARMLDLTEREIELCHDTAIECARMTNENSLDLLEEILDSYIRSNTRIID